MKKENIPLYHLARALRPRQWIKNFSILAASMFWGNLFDPGILNTLIIAFLAFCAISSSMYLINDIADAKRDARHPIKKNRPIPSGNLKVITALLTSAVLFITSIYLGITYINKFFTMALLIYVFIQIAYSFYLRNVIIMDALTVAFGFVLRVYAGALSIPVPISSWLVLTTIGVSLLLAFGKRRSERTILEGEKIDLSTRKTLKHYPDALLDSMISLSSSITIITYSLFAFQVSPTGTRPAFLGILPATLSRPKWMMLTIPIVIYGVARYLYVIYEKKEGESPERILLSDAPLLFSTTGWTILILIIVYLIGDQPFS